jgi:myosin XVIII
VNSLSSKYELTSEYTFQTSNGNESKENSNSVYDGQFPLPNISSRPLLPVRTLTIKRSHEHGFGFSLRKVGIANRVDSMMRYVIFAEPAKSDSGLVPGDRLLRVNGIAVENFSMEKIVEMIRNSGDKIIVEVQPIAELTELAIRCNPLDYPISRITTLERKYEENGKSSEEKVWLMHRAGYSSAKILKPANDSGKISISLDHSEEQLFVDEFSVSTKNPDDLDFAEDICQLKYLNEPSVLHCIRSRFTNNLIHTRAGPSLIVVNPTIHLPIYSDKIITALKSCKSENMPPHIYSLAQSSYREMLESRRDQSLIFIGNSSSGKSTSFKHAIFYLTLMAGSNKILNAEKINAVHTILDYFGNSQTTTNVNATRFTQLFSINFDHIGQIVSASIQVILMDKSIIGRRSKRNESSIDVISRLIVGVEGNLRKELLLDTITNFGNDNNLFINIPSQLEERQKLSEEFKNLVQAFQILGIDERMTKALWSILAAIYHLGSASVSRSGTNSRIQFENAVSAKRAANLIGVSVDKLHDMIFSSLGNNSKLAASPIDGEDKELNTAIYILEGIVSALYNEVFTTIVSLINKVISTSANSVASIILIDSPGLQIPMKNQTASLDDLKNNYLQERLQQLFHHVHLMMPHDRYSQEMIEISVERMSGFSSLVKLIDQSPRNNHVTKSPKQNENDKTSGLGLFCLLDDESSQFNSNDESFLQKLFTIFNDESSKFVMKKGPNRQQFYLYHFQGTTPVLYSVKGWLKECQNNQFTKNAMNLLQESGRDEIITLINEGFKVGSYNTLKDGNQSLRRVSSIRRSFGSASSKRNSSMLQIKLTVDGLIDTLRRTNTHFIHCFTSQPLKDDEKSDINLIDIPQLSSQVRGSLIIEAARLHRNGFPEYFPIDEFVRRYGLLNSEVSKESITVETILKSNESEIDSSSYRVGSTQVKFKENA